MKNLSGRSDMTSGARRSVVFIVCGIVVLFVLRLIPTDGPGPGESDTLRILSGAENQSLEPLIQSFADERNVAIEFTFAGSIDIMRELNKGADSSYDAVWPANRMWIELGDASGSVQHVESIARSPIV